VLRTRSLTVTAVAFALLLPTSLAWAQFPGRTPGATFFPDIPVRGPVVLYPTLTLGGEFNDNVFLTDERKRSDFILSLTPAVRLVLESTTYRWATGYSLTAEKYIDNTELDSAVQRQNFFINGFHRLDPRLTLSLSEVFIEDKNSNLVSEQNIAVGRRTSRSNSFTPGLTWQFAPQTSLVTSFSYTLQRFDDAAANDSDVFRLTTDVNHDFTSRLTGIAGYEVRYLDVERQVGLTTHTPRVGVAYQFTPTVSGSLIAGPTVRVSKEETGLSPFVSASLTSLFAWGEATAFASHYVGTAGGLGGTTENTTVGGLVQVTTLLRDLVLEAAPAYFISKSVGNSGDIDVRSFTLDLRAAYRFTPWLAAVGGYRLFLQRSDSATASLARDIDQNRVFVGVQFGYAKKFD
jgi:hypothetical protein